MTRIEDPGPARVPAALSFGLLGLGVIGLIGFAVGLFSAEGEAVTRVWMGFLVSYLFFFFLAMGAAAFLAISHVTGAKWYIVLKRPLEAIASFVFRGGFVFPLVGLLGTGALYSWAAETRDYPYEGTLKALWLTPAAHYVKVFAYVAMLTAITFLLLRASISGVRLAPDVFRKRQLRMGIAFLIIFAPIFSLFCMDVVMSLSPAWFSTMFGVYCFAGAIVSAVSLTMLIAFWLRRKTPLVRERQMYDLGTYVMAYATFMIYIGFSQFMLIWYANIPDETFFFLDRYEGGWVVLTLALPLLKWVIPFFVLMPPPMRTNIFAQSFVCLAILGGQLLDIYWMVAPTFSEEAYGPSLWNILAFLGVGGVFGWSTLSFLGAHAVLPTSDPDLVNSVNGDYLHA